MTAVPVLIPKIPVPKIPVQKIPVQKIPVPAARDAGPAWTGTVRSIDRQVLQPAAHKVPTHAIAHATSTPGSWQLTDRGIALAMVIAAVILTAAVVVIGITAVRVTSADYDPGPQWSQQAQR